MADTIVSQSATWDPKLGNFITTTTLENLTAFPTIPAGAVDVTKSKQDGVYRVTYKDIGDSTGGGGGGGGGASSYNYEAHSSVSTEPLITFGSFGAGGSWALDDDDKKKIKSAESNPTEWRVLAVSPKTGLSKYANFILSGIESFYAPSITVTITADESSVPDLSNLGKIASISNVPTLPSGGNWLFAGCNFSALQNSKWRVSREYRASGKGGWNPDLYGAG
jgi:hypothetical protein